MSGLFLCAFGDLVKLLIFAGVGGIMSGYEDRIDKIWFAAGCGFSGGFNGCYGGFCRFGCW